MLKVLEAGVFVAGLVLYLTPAIIADARGRQDAFAVTVFNVLLGWTMVGWLAAFVWARHPVSDRRLMRTARKTRLAIARMTIDSIVARARRRTMYARLQPIPIRAERNTAGRTGRYER
jgi:Superinfection immunity protein